MFSSTIHRKTYSENSLLTSYSYKVNQIYQVYPARYIKCILGKSIRLHLELGRGEKVKPQKKKCCLVRIGSKKCLMLYVYSADKCIIWAPCILS